MKPTWMIGSLIVIAVVAVVVLGYLGFIPGLNLRGVLSPGDENAPPGAVYCDYTEMQILDLLETVANKDLNNGVGISFVRALNMQACGSDGESVASIVAHYMVLNEDWFVIYDDSNSGSGWTARVVVWANDPVATNATLIKSVMIGDGITVKSAYGYDTITTTGDGTMITYQAFILWVATS